MRGMCDYTARNDTCNSVEIVQQENMPGRVKVVSRMLRQTEMCPNFLKQKPSRYSRMRRSDKVIHVDLAKI